MFVRSEYEVARVDEQVDHAGNMERKRLMQRNITGNEEIIITAHMNNEIGRAHV